MNSAANIANTPQLPAAERVTGTTGAVAGDEQSQVRFADVLRGQRSRDAEAARNAKDAAEATEAKGGQSTADAGEPDGAPAQAMPADAAATAAAAAPTAPDPAIIAMLLDPARDPAARPVPLAGTGFGTTIRSGKDIETAAGAADSAGMALASAADAARTAEANSIAQAVAGAAMPPPRNPAASPGAAENGAEGVRAAFRPGAGGIASSGEQPRGEPAASRPQLPFGMAADSPVRGETPALEAGRIDPAGWAAFAVPVDSAAARQNVAAPLPPIEAPVGSPRFVDETAQQVTWLVKNGLNEAEIRVRPADMGPISVRIEMNQNEATISFAVTQPETRAAVQDSLHRLTEMLAESGISLGEANVGGNNFAQQSRDGGAGRSRVTFAPSRADSGVGGIPAGGRVLTGNPRGLVDTFA